MKLSVIILLLFAVTNFSQAQSVISGRVQQQNGDPLPGVNAYLDGTYDGTSSDGDGYFSFSSDEQGAQTLKVEFMGFEDYSRSVELTGDSLYISVVLQEAFNELTAVTITAGSFEASDKRKSVTISPLDMVTTAGANGDVFGALQSLPGTTTNGESGRLFVKGGDSRESQTYIDGAWVPVPYNSTAPNVGTRGRYNPFMFKGMVFSTGGYSAEYGQALSSVLLLNTNDLPETDQLDLSFLSIGAELAGTKRWNTGAITATGSYTNLGPYMSLVKQNLDWVKKPESLSGALSFRQQTGKTGMLKVYSNIDQATFTVKQENLDAGGETFDYQLDNLNAYSNASWKGMLGEKLGMNTALSYTYNTDEIYEDENKITNTLKAFYLKSGLNYAFTEKFLLKGGAEWTAMNLEENYDNGSDTYSQSVNANLLAAYSEAQVYASNRFVNQIGLRAEYADVLNDWRVAPRISSAYKLGKYAQLSAAYGWFYQLPDQQFLLQENNLKAERADHYTFTYLLNRNNRTLRAELYYKDYKDLVKYSSYANGEYQGLANSGSGYARGIDLFWRDKVSIKGGDYWISYSYIDTKRNYRDYPYQARPGFASKHNLAVVYKYWFGGIRSLLGVNFNYSSPRVYNNPNESVFNSEKMRAYRSLDVSWSFLYRQNIIIYGAVTNLPGFKNEYGNTYASQPDDSGYYASRPVLPTADRFFILACFITLSGQKSANQLDKIQ